MPRSKIRGIIFNMEVKKMKKFFVKNELIKIIGITIVLMAILSWIIPTGYYSEGELISNGLARVGIETFFNAGFTGFSYYSFQILFLLILGGFYGLLSIVPGYRKLVSTLAKGLKGNKLKTKLAVVGMGLFFAAFTSLSNDILPVLTFVPFVISILLKANQDKLTAFSVTFGSILVGLLGATYSHFTFDYINSYMGTELLTGMGYKALIFGVAFATLMLITTMHMNKDKKEKNNENEDLYVIEDLGKKEKTKIWPIAVVLGVLLIFSVIGYINWNTNFKITIFTNFYTWIQDFRIGKYAILVYLLGLTSLSHPLGELQLISMGIALLLGGGIISAIYRIKFDECLDAFASGIKKILKPTLLYFLAIIVFVISYQIYLVPTIAETILGWSTSFNPFLLAIVGIIAAAMNVDHGFTAYTLGAMLAARYATATTAAMLVMNTTYGLTQFIAPSGVLLFFGLCYLNISYKSYFKFIWKFLLSMTLILLLVYAMISF